MGGAVRDMLLGRKPKDFDVLTTATPVQVAPAPCSAYYMESTNVTDGLTLLCVLRQRRFALQYLCVCRA